MARRKRRKRFSWKRTVNKIKREVYKAVGIPTTQAARRRKARSLLWRIILGR